MNLHEPKPKGAAEAAAIAAKSTKTTRIFNEEQKRTEKLFV